MNKSTFFLYILLFVILSNIYLFLYFSFYDLFFFFILLCIPPSGTGVFELHPLTFIVTLLSEKVDISLSKQILTFKAPTAGGSALM